MDRVSVAMEGSRALGIVIGGGSPHDYRVKATFLGNAQNASDKSPWAYFRYR